MSKLIMLAAALPICACLSGRVLAEETTSFDAEIAVIDSQINEVDATIARLEGGLIRALAETRRETLLLLRAVVQIRQQAEVGDVTTEVTVPSVEPDPLRAEQILGEMASQQQRIELAEKEAASAGGLIKALALGRVETEKLTMAQLQMAYLQAHYGIAFPKLAGVITASKPSSGTQEGASFSAKDKDVAAKVPWADPDHPDIDYSLAPFEKAHKDGDRISGWWVIKEERAAIDDSPRIFAINYSAYDVRSFRDVTVLVAQCREGETSFIFLQDDYLIKDLGTDSFDVAYRIDQKPAETTRWNGLTSNKGVGLFGAGAEQFFRKLYDAESFFIRLTEGNGQRHDEEFDLAGTQETVEAVAGACGWSTLDLTKDDYRAIQTMLNAGGFDVGTPDGIWGSGSRAALRSFQKQAGIPPTGAPDRTTLKALGVQIRGANN